MDGLERLVADANGVTDLSGGGVRDRFYGDPTNGSIGHGHLRGSVLTGNPDGSDTLARKGGDVHTFDAAGRLTARTDINGLSVSYGYDAAGNRIVVTHADPDGAGPRTSPVYQYGYDAVGNLMSATDPLGAVTGYVYDGLDRLVEFHEADPDGAAPYLSSPVWAYAYDAAGNRTAVTDPLGETTVTSHDLLGRVTAVADPFARTRSYAYDAAGNLTSETDPLGNVTAYAYDTLNRVTARTGPDPDGAGGPLAASVTTYGYDRRGMLASVTDPLGAATTFSVDGWRLLTAEASADPDGTGPLAAPLTSYAHDAAGRMTSLTDPNGNVTAWGYDSLGRVTSETNAANASRHWTYDASGNLLTRTDRDGRLTAYTHDLLGQLTAETFLAADDVTVLDAITRTWDAAGRLSSIADGDSTLAYTRDALGRVLVASNVGTPDATPVNVYSGYDGRSRRITQTVLVNGVWDAITWTEHDGAAQVWRVVQDAYQTGGHAVAEKRVDLAYDDNGRFHTITRYADRAATREVATTSYGYDHAGRLTDLDHTTAGGTVALANYDYAFDAAHRLTRTVSADGTTDFAHDAGGQLTGADHSYQTDEAFTYDAAGNRTNAGYATGTANRLLSDGTHTYQYDAEGRRTKRTEIATGDYAEYAWDHNGNLTAVSFFTQAAVLTKKVTYRYDGHGRRIAKDVDDNGDGLNDRGERHTWDGEGGFGHVDNVILTTDAAGAVTHRYLHGPATDLLFADENGMGEVLWGLGDHQSTVRDWVEYDTSAGRGVVTNHVTYDAFGTITSQTDPSHEITVAYTGQDWDADAELYYYRARWYDAVAGRFLSEDPSGFAAGDANLQRYVGNGAATRTDPTGLQDLELSDEPFSDEELGAIPRPPVEAPRPFHPTVPIPEDWQEYFDLHGPPPKPLPRRTGKEPIPLPREYYPYYPPAGAPLGPEGPSHSTGVLSQTESQRCVPAGPEVAGRSPHDSRLE